MEGKGPENSRIIGSWNGLTKNKDDECEIHLLHKYEPIPSPEDESRFLSQASPVIINSPEVKTRKANDQQIALFPDIHYGFRRLPNGELHPSHNPEALDLWLQIVEREQPKTIIIQGDGVDAAEVGKFDPDYNHYADTLQLEVDGMHALLCRIRTACPNSEITYIRGNHDLRFQKNIIRHSMPLLGVRQANLPESFAVNTLPFLLRLQELEIAYQENYMATEKLLITHGEFSATRGSAAAKYLGFYALSTCYAHDHRIGYETRTFPDGTKRSAFGFGCLADIKGSVPSYHSKVDDKGFVVPNFENWDSGAGFIEVSKNGLIQPQFVNLEHEQAKYNSRVYKARQEVIEALRAGK